MITDNEQTAIEQTTRIVVAALGHDGFTVQDFPAFIKDIYTALVSLPDPMKPEPIALVPSVPVKKSVTPDYIICLEDGKKFKSMRRHLSKLGMTPEQYREKWGLPSDYPIVAASYSAKRSQMAKDNGLGKKK